MFMFIHVEAHREDTLAFRLHYGLFLRLAEWVAFLIYIYIKKKKVDKEDKWKNLSPQQTISGIRQKAKNNNTLVGLLRSCNFKFSSVRLEKQKSHLHESIFYLQT